MTSDPAVLLQLRIASENDVFLARQRGRRSPRSSGSKTRTRCGWPRRSARSAGSCRRCPSLPRSPCPWSPRRPPPWWSRPDGSASSRRSGCRTARRRRGPRRRRPADRCRELTWAADGGSVTLTKVLPPGAPPLTRARIAQLRAGQSTRGRATRWTHCVSRTTTCSRRWRTSRPARRTSSRPTPSWRRPTAASWRCTRTVRRAGADQPGRRRAVRRARRGQHPAQGGQRVEEPVLGKRQPRAAHAAQLVLGLARLLLIRASDAAHRRAAAQVEMIHDSGAMLLSLVNELLDVAKAESGRLEPHPEPTELRTVLDQVRASMAPLASPDVALVVEDPPNTPPPRHRPAAAGAHPAQPGQQRAQVHRAGRGPLPRQCGRRTAGHRRVRHGHRHPREEHRSRVFEEFHQVPGPLQATGRGTGSGCPMPAGSPCCWAAALELDSEVDRGRP